MTQKIRRKAMAVILTLTMVMGLLPAMTLSAAAADTYMVKNTNDSGAESLRWAFTQAAAASDGSTITFDPSLAGATITLTSGALPNLPSTTGDFTLVGLTDADGKPNITIDGNGHTGFSALGSGDFAISNTVFTGFSLTTGTTAGDGNAAVLYTGVENAEDPGYNTLNLYNCEFTGNTDEAVFRGAAVQLTATTITVDRCIFTDNTLISTGAETQRYPMSAALSVSGNATIRNSLFSENTFTANKIENTCIVDGCAIIVRDEGSFGVSILSNTFYKNRITNSGSGGAAGAVISHEGTGESCSLSVYNNIMLENTANESINNIFSVPTPSTGFNVDTGTASDIFTDFETDDFTLKSNEFTASNVIDQGGNDYSSGDYDLAGNPRKVGTIDIGAYEFSPLTIAPTSALTEENLDSNSLTVTLSGTTFADANLDTSNFTLNTALVGVSITGVTHNSPTECTITLAYSGTDFDTGETVSLTVKGAELDSGSDLTSGTLTITATVETAPTVTTASVSTYAATSATMGGEVTASGGETVTGRGVVYCSTDATPTIGEEGVAQDANGTGTGIFSESISGLFSNTTYYVRAYATNSVGTSYGSVVSFTTTAISALIAPASALTEENLDTNSLSVTLSGTTFADGTLDKTNFTLNNAPTGVTVESVTYTDTTHCSVNLTYNGTDFDTNVTNFSLTVKAAELAYGSDLTSGTLTITATDETAPTVTTGTASSITSSAATLSGTVNANNADTTVTFEYGTTDSYGSSIAASPDTVTGAGATSVSCALSGLALNTTYHYRVKAVSKGGTTCGLDMTFSTDVTAPTILSATRTDDTHITITMSEACQNLAKENDGGFTVTKTGAATTYAVSATSAGAGNTLVLTVADISSAGAVGVTITYTAEGTNGTIADIAGNALETDGTGKAVAAWDTTAPTVSGVENGVIYNTNRTATFDEGTATLDGNPVTSPITVSNEGSHTLTVTDAAGNSTTVTFTIDKTAPTISSVTPTNGTHKAGGIINFTVTFSETVSVNTDSGTPYLTLKVGSTVVHAAYVSCSGSSLVFSYTVAPGDTDSNGIDLVSDITLNSGTIKDTAGNNATVTFAGSTAAGVLVDTTAPTILGVTPVNGTYIAGQNLDFTVTFSEAVSVNTDSGTPYLTLTVGSTDVQAAYVSGSGSALVFRYTVVSGDADSTGVDLGNNITLNSGTIKDAAGNDATLSFTPPTTTAVKVDGVAPAISSASIVSGNTYIDILFSEGVYGAGDGTAALTAEKLALTFTQNSGSATDVTISSIKKADDTAEASASALTGGETTVRVFLTITGTPSGAESIEIKPASASSVYDKAGNAMASTQTTGAKALLAPASYGGESSDSSGAEVIVNGKPQNAGTTQTTTNSSGQTTTTVTVDTDKLQRILDSQSTGATVTIPISGNSDVAAGTLTGAMVKNMENKDATLVVQTASGTYTLPASEIDIDAVSQQLGTDVSLSDINVTVSISEPSASMTQVVENAAQDGGFTIMVPAVDYTITCTHGSQTINVSSFNAYVERTIAIPDGVDPTKITTGVVVDSDGTTHHVPTRVELIGGKYYAVINSLTNSTYSVVWNPIEFSDVAKHWAKDAINNLGSRMIVTGVGNNNYAPNRNMTRAQFATIMIRALGLEPETGASGFGDVASTDWCSGYIKVAVSYGIIKGYDNGNFGPNDTITREQAMTIITRAMAITKLNAGLTDSEIGQLLSTFSDKESASSYAKESIAACLKTGITTGTSDTTISPKANITRAEVAVMVQRLLQKSGLI